jgi:hypothetical protein
MMRFSVVFMIVFTCILPQVVRAQITQVLPHEAPKLANYFLANQLKAEDIPTLAKWDVGIFPMDFGVLYPERLRELKRRNPDMILLAYVTSQETIRDFTGLKTMFPLRYRLFQGIRSEWYLTDTNGATRSFWPGTSLLNVTLDAPRMNGETWVDHLSTFMATEVLVNTVWDGVFYDNAWDNITYFSPGAIDLNRDGRADTDLDQKWRQGMSTLFTQTREKTGRPIVLVGNNDTLAYAKELNGMMLENYASTRAQELFAKARQNATSRATPRVNIINSNTGNTGNRAMYQAMRFGLTSALLTDSYFSFDYGDKNHGQLWWYDEYNVDLGEPIDTVHEVGVQPGVWQREFARGAAVVNAGTTRAVVELGADYETIHGTVDKEVNSGAIVQSVTLPPADGRVLLKPLETLTDVVFKNGWFARFYTPTGARARNGFFAFSTARRAGARMIETDLNADTLKDVVIVHGARLLVYRHDGELLMDVYPYSANYTGDIRLALIPGTEGKQDILVAPGAGNAAPLKRYSVYGDVLFSDIFPFGLTWRQGVSIAVGDVHSSPGLEIIIGSGAAAQGKVVVLTGDGKRVGEWQPFPRETLHTLAVAVGQMTAEPQEEVVVGALTKTKMILSIFSGLGKQLVKEVTPLKQVPRELELGAYDVTFDGQDEVVVLTPQAGL